MTSLSKRDLATQLSTIAKRLKAYRFVLFVVFVAAIYGLVLMRITSLTNIQPSPDAVTGQVQSAHLPRIDESVIQQLESLQDNSVSVKTLFETTRSNPFQ